MNRTRFLRFWPDAATWIVLPWVMALGGFSEGLALGGDTNLPVVSVIAVAPATDEEGGAAGEFRVERSGGDPSHDLKVYYRIAGSAGNGVDYQGLTGTVTLRAGESTEAIRLLPIDDAEIESPETVEVRLCAQNEPFALAILPDTQYYVVRGGAGTPEMFFEQTRWIANHRDAENIVFVLHEGDVTDLNTEGEWLRGRAAMRVLDGLVPYAITPGNHDGLTQSLNLTERFNQHFPVTDYERLPAFGGVFEPGRLDNSYHFFSAGGVDWMVLVLEFGPRNAVLAWANEVVAAHPERRVIVLTHAHLYPDDTLQGAPEHLWNPTSSGRQNNGTDVWEKLLRRHSNISFVFSGHAVVLPPPNTPGGPDGVGRLVGIGDSGNRVFQMLADYQYDPLGGGGYLRLVRFFPARDELQVSTYSPYLRQSLTDDANQFADDQLGIFTPTNGGYQIDPANAAATMTITSHDLDATPLAVNRVFSYGAPPKVEVTFSQPVETASAQDPARYSLEGGLAVTRATLSGDARKVTLDLIGPIQYGTTYTLTINGVRDLAVPPGLLANSLHVFEYRPVLLAEDFNQGDFRGWKVVDEGNTAGPSSWSVWEGALNQFSNIYGPAPNLLSGREGTFVYWDETASLNWSNYTASATLNTLDDDGIGLLFRYQDRSNYYKVDLDRQRVFRKLFKVVGGVETQLASEAVAYAMGVDLPLRIVANGEEITVFLDDQALFGGAVTDGSLSQGTVGLYSWGNAGVAFDDVFVRPLLPERLPPSVRLSDPQDGLSTVAPADLTLSADIGRPAGEIGEVRFYRDAVHLGTVTAPPFTLLCTNVPSGDYTFTTRARDDTGLVGLSPPVHVHVSPTPEPPTLAMPPRSYLAMPHTSIELTVQAGGTWPLSYQWFHDGVLIPGATNVLLALGDLHAADEGAYRVEVRNRVGATTSAQATVRLVPPGGLGVFWRAPPFGQQLEISVIGDAGGSVRLEKSANLREWSLLADTNAFAGTWSGMVNLGEANPTQFFRAIRY